MKLILALTAAAVAAATLTATAGARPRAWPVPPRAYAAALCIHSGWHYEPAIGWKQRRRLARSLRHGPDYWNGKVAFYRTYDVPDSILGGSGEGGWSTVNGYGGGMQMLLGTYNRAADYSHGRLPHLYSNGAIAELSPGQQIYAAFLVARSDHGSWHEWPLTSRACGLP